MSSNFKLFLWLSLGFAICVPVGTLTHELGHWLAYQAMGFTASISYAFTSLEFGELNDQQFLIAVIAGPCITMLIGTTGFVYLLLSRRKIRLSEKLSTIHWTMIFLALFWMRPLVDLAFHILIYLVRGDFPKGSDEARISVFFGLPYWSLPVLTAAAGSGVFLFVWMKLIPRGQRMTFFAAGLAGGIFGFASWMGWIGPLLLPDK